MISLTCESTNIFSISPIHLRKISENLDRSPLFAAWVVEQDGKEKQWSSKKWLSAKRSHHMARIAHSSVLGENLRSAMLSSGSCYCLLLFPFFSQIRRLWSEQSNLVRHFFGCMLPIHHQFLISTSIVPSSSFSRTPAGVAKSRIARRVFLRRPGMFPSQSVCWDNKAGTYTNISPGFKRTANG